MTERLQNPGGIGRIEAREGVAEIDWTVSARDERNDEREDLPLAGGCRCNVDKVRRDIPVDSDDAHIIIDPDRLAAEVFAFKPPLVCDQQSHGGFGA